MDKLMQVFQYNGAQVRTVIKDGEPWFVAKDVCDILELGNTAQAITRLEKDEFAFVPSTIISDDSGGPQRIIVSEPGLYALVLGSRKPEAKEFKRWVTHEVLPQIRKTGSYSIQPMTEIEILQRTVNLLAEQDRRLRELEESRDKQENLLAETHQKAHHLEAKLKDVQRGLVDINIPLREQFNLAVRDLAFRRKIMFQAAYDMVYDTLDAQEGIRLRVRAEHAGVRPIDILERSDLLTKATRLAKAL